MKSWELLGGLLKRIGEYNVHEWKDRLIVQKIIYILQRGFNQNLGYNFSWYVHGPYSSQLANDFYKLKNSNNVPFVKYKDVEKNQRFENFMNIISNYKKDPDLLELTASLFFISKDGTLDNGTLLNRIAILKPYFEEEKYREALEIYRNIINLGPLN